MFISKLINLKLNIYQKIKKEEKIDILNKINLNNFIYYLEIKYNKEEIIIMAFEEKNIINNNYEFVYQLFDKIGSNNNNFYITSMSWKNQFLVSSIIDFYSGGLVNNLPKSFKSLERDIKLENELNTKIFYLVNIWLKKYGGKNVIQNKLNFLNEN